LKDYDVHFQYHPGKANVVTDALGIKLLASTPNDLCEEFQKLELNVINPETKPMLCAFEAQLTLIEEIRVAHTTYPQVERIKEEIFMGKAP